MKKPTKPPPTPPANKGPANPHLVGQVRRQLQKHYISKYRGGRGRGG